MSNNRHDYWDHWRGRIDTKRGGWCIGQAVYNRGYTNEEIPLQYQYNEMEEDAPKLYSMMVDLVGKKSFFQVLVLNAIGRLPNERLAKWFEASFICLSWPDSRIWCNQNGSLAGTSGASPVAASAAGILSANSRMYGPGSLTGGAEFIIKAKGWYDEYAAEGNMSDDEIVKTIVERELDEKRKQSKSRPVVVGYARPLATGDERVEAMRKVTKELGFSELEHVKLAFKISEYLDKVNNESMNYVGYVVAFLTDLGITAKEMYRIYSTWVHSGVHACYSESADWHRGSFFPWACEDIVYTGKEDRPVPD